MSIFNPTEKYCEKLTPINIEKENGECYQDPTAYEALIRLDEDARFHLVMKTIFNLLNIAGFYLDGRMTIVSKKTGRTWK